MLLVWSFATQEDAPSEQLQEMKATHGLSLYIETRSHKILFDLGSDNTLFENAVKRNIDISKVDTVIISREQNLIISENQVAVIMGCGHVGVANIMGEAKLRILQNHMVHFSISDKRNFSLCTVRISIILSPLNFPKPSTTNFN